MSLGQAYRDDVTLNFKKYKDYAEKAFQQVSDESFFAKPGQYSNSIALIVKHLAGNLKSRFTEFLSSDGDKPWRDRDGEFTLSDLDNRTTLTRAWEEGWRTLFASLAGLQESDLLKKVLIRSEEHTVMQALDRALAHTAYHVGQIAYLSRMLTTDGWKWITIPPGQSRQHTTGQYLK